MGIVTVLLAVAYSLPITIASLSYLLRFSLDFYTAIGFLSMLALPYVKRSVKGIVVVIYLPAALSLGLLFMTGNPSMLIGLATGYILVSPIELIISSVSQGPASTLVSYIFAYFISIMLVDAVSRGANSSLTLLPYLVRTAMEGRFGAGLAEDMVGITAIMLPMTAIASVVLAFSVMLKERYEGFEDYLIVIKALVVAAVTSILLATLSSVDILISSIVLPASAMIMLALSSYFTRK